MERWPTVASFADHTLWRPYGMATARASVDDNWGRQVVSADVARQVTDMLVDAVPMGMPVALVPGLYNRWKIGHVSGGAGGPVHTGLLHWLVCGLWSDPQSRALWSWSSWTVCMRVSGAGKRPAPPFQGCSSTSWTMRVSSRMSDHFVTVPTTLADVLAVLAPGWTVAGARDIIVDTVCIDSRLARPGSLFIALPGDHVDGHDFVPAALSAGARIAIVERPVAGVPCVDVVEPNGA